jgi:hypothetical protein
MVMQSKTVKAQKVAGHKFSFKKKISFKNSSAKKVSRRVAKKSTVKRKARSKA